MKRILTVILAAVVCVSLAGCRESDVIQELVDNINAEQSEQVAMNHTKTGKTDEQAALDRESEKGEDPGKKAKNKKSSEQEKDQEQEEKQGEPPVNDVSAENGNTTTQQHGDTGETGVSDQGGGETAADGEGGDGDGAPDTGKLDDGSGDGGKGDKKTDDNGEEGDGSAGDDEDGDDDDNNSHKGDNTTPLTADDENARQIKDASGNEIYIPNNVNTVAAQGEAAVIAQMLGGAGTLVATSGDFLNNALSMRVFADELTVSPACVWDSADDRTMDDGEFQTLLAADPDCVVLLSENTFTEAQRAELTQHEIGVVLLPNLSTTAKIKEAVTIVGQVLKNKQDGGVDSVSLAGQYCSYMDGLIEKVERQGNGYFHPQGANYDIDLGVGADYGNPTAASGRYTAYLTDWMDDFHLEYWYDGMGEYIFYQDGVPLTWLNYAGNPVFYYMCVGGVLNVPTRWLNYNYTASADVLNPVWNTGYRYHYDTGSFEEIPRSNAIQYDEMGENYLVGMEMFPAFIVKERSIRERLLASKNSSLSMYRLPEWSGRFMGKYSAVLLCESGWWDINAENTSDGSLPTTIWGDYGIYVNPIGVGDWTMGHSAEGVLETIWISYIIYNGAYFTLEDVKNEVAGFYRTFYRYEVTESDLSSILQLDVN